MLIDQTVTVWNSRIDVYQDYHTRVERGIFLLLFGRP